MPSDHDLGVAFAMTAGAGLATSIGAATVFLPNFDDKKYLGMSLAFAAGVMLYVSFVEIFVKSSDAFVAYFDQKDGVDTATVTVDDYEAPKDAYYCLTATFFAGIAITWMLDHAIHLLNEESKQAANNDAALAASSLTVSLPQNGVDGSIKGPCIENDIGVALKDKDDESHAVAERTSSYTTAMSSLSAITSRTAIQSGPTESVIDRRLIRMALVTGLAITLHNFPEGLATFIASAQEPANGAPIAIAIGVHNIPEGICVAAPIFHATGSRWKAFFWGTASGLAETVAGAIGWIILSQRDADMGWLAYAMLFGLVAGMMVFISFNELIVTALEYDPHRRYFMPVLTLGMGVMAASLMIFQEA